MLNSRFKRQLCGGLAVGILLAITPFTSAVSSDRIDTVNGSTVIGRVLKLSDGMMLIETDFAGTLEIPFTHITGVTTAEPVKVCLDSGDVLVGRLSSSGEQELQVSSELGVISVNQARLLAILPPGQDLVGVLQAAGTPVPKTGEWSYEAAVNISGRSGNADSFSSAGSLAAVLTHPHDRLRFYLHGSRAKDAGNETADEIRGGIDYEREFSRLHSWYSRVELEKDGLEGLDLRTTAALGYGYYWIRTDRHELRNRLGLLVRQESYEDGRSEQTLGLDFGLYHMYLLNQRLKLLTDLTYTPSIEDISDYRVDHETALELPLLVSNLWKLRLGIAHEYNSHPASGREKLDTTWFAKLVLSWK